MAKKKKHTLLKAAGAITVTAAAAYSGASYLVFRNAFRLDCREPIIVLHITLTLLVERCEAVTYELVCERAGYTINRKRVARMLERRQVPTHEYR